MTAWNESPRDLAQFRRRLLRWFDQHQRDLPWRTNRTPYRIWVSEIMLQQTQVATVVDYYQRFLASFPSVQELAAADVADVLKHWEGLGYYRRARQMHAAAGVIMDEHGGEFPTGYDQVLALPGIGRYTAGAILSIALDRPYPILEGNTIRLFARLLEMKTDPRSTANQKRLWGFSEQLLPRKRCGDFNQALMELGSELCSPRSPQCLICPVRALCPTGIKGLHEQIPVRSKRVQYEDLHEAVVVVSRRRRYLVRQCLPGERWQGLWDFPRFELPAGRAPEAVPDQLADQLKSTTGLAAQLANTGIRIKHAVTRFRITLDCFRAESVSGRLKRSGAPMKWMTAGELAEAPMSTTGRKIAERCCATEN